MKLIPLMLIALLIVIVFNLCTSPAIPHSNERTAIYNLSGMMHAFARQLDRIEARLDACIVNNDSP